MPIADMAAQIATEGAISLWGVALEAALLVTMLTTLFISLRRKPRRRR